MMDKEVRIEYAKQIIIDTMKLERVEITDPLTYIYSGIYKNIHFQTHVRIFNKLKFVIVYIIQDEALGTKFFLKFTDFVTYLLKVEDYYEGKSNSQNID
ncbi:MAG TPA: hypothetical protein P5545_07810 [Bacteroidota bacterium]|jgi:hypothetical protein|nr:hypothetical protein [Candidatus Kapabacteria bacterium]HRS02438.1 hypothetical protein [Bacteroidota bacterium]